MARTRNRNRGVPASEKRKPISVYLSEENHRRLLEFHARMKVKIPLSSLGELAIVRLIQDYERNPEQLLLDFGR